MSRAGTTTTAGEPRSLRLALDLVVLTKPRISVFVWLAALVGALLAGGAGSPFLPAAEAAFWVMALASAANAFNQILERDLDRRMERTCERPLPSGRLRPRDAILFATALAVVGTVALATRFGAVSALLGLASLASYTLVYTPLKRVSTFNTLVGAFPGAAPPLVGYAAIAGEPGPWAWAIFAVIFAWQFPHFLAIAWLYREDYRRAGFQMLPAVDGGAGLAGRQAFLYCLVLLPVSLLPVTRGDAGVVYAATAIVFGLAYLVASALFAVRETRARARAVLFSSLVYLPVVLSSILFDPVVREMLLPIG